ncbi:carbon monoxide dehydrogenase subunit G [Caballeronia arationis]|jgi:carbon monoxide dehydrogenase subunit G|uniref:Carbon monoxide dehydrogenase subunit G n=1 Tax=Caballeronia arationis TaxID=1777142 RepID=A0A7Z7I871_9BURK|nr:SRPBCC domain-containing protein [Caballeronia arationis]SAK81580.1 carbon monoxide dehydrogenase subunit G [Caballeronia arationis]SOE80722.1 Carbon monoxide dehydrogenase subunit G [Caballeronia arationis]
MEVTDALRVPLDPVHVREALGDLALLRASLDNCESFAKLPGGEYALTMIVPLGALRARYEIRAHGAGVTRQNAHTDGEADAAAPTPDAPGAYARTLSFKARGEGVGSLRGQIAVALNPDANGESTWIEYTLWATVSGPLAGLPSRQIENSLREVADDFFSEFCEVVRAKHGLSSIRAQQEPGTRRHVFLRPNAMSAAFMRRPGAAQRQMRPGGADAASGVLHHRLPGHGLGHRDRDHSHDPHPLGLPGWAWAAMLVCIALFAFLAPRVGLQ